MDEPHKIEAQTSEIKNVLPDVVHSQQIPVLGDVVNNETVTELDTGQTSTEGSRENPQNEEGTSDIESISEYLPSKMDYSLTKSEDVGQSHSKQPTNVEADGGKSNTSSLNVPISTTHPSGSLSPREPLKQSTSWNLEVNPASVVHLSEESPLNLTISSDTSKENAEEQKLSVQSNVDDSLRESQKSGEFLDSLNENFSQRSDKMASDVSLGKSSSLGDKDVDCSSKCSTGSEEIIKLDIRGQGVPKFPLQAGKIIFGPPPEGSTLVSATENIPVFKNLLSPFLVGVSDSVNIEEVFDEGEPPLIKELTPDKSLPSSSPSSGMEQDVLVEEVTMDNDRKEKAQESIEATPKSIAPEETASFSTLTTEYKTICEEYQEKLVHLEDAITGRDRLIDELTVSLQRSVRERDELKLQNDHLIDEVRNLQHMVAEGASDHDTIKAQLSDFVKYHALVKDDSTKFYSAVMSGTDSVQSSNGEKDMDREEIIVNYSKSDLRSSGSSEDIQPGFEHKLTGLLTQFEDFIEENLRNKLRESLIQILCDEIGKLRLENDAELRQLELQMKREQQAFASETRRLRELLATVQSGSADVDALRQELAIEHNRQMENLRTYFEKKCLDMERSYSEEVWRGRACASPGSGSERDECDLAAGDGRRRARSADLPSLTMETSTPLEQSLRQVGKRHERQLEELRAAHLADVADLRAAHQAAVGALEDQITQLKAHIQSSENTEPNVSVYQQDIDLELEKDAQKLREEVRRDMLQQLQDQLQVLLSDPDAELSSWPLELVALRERIHGDAARCDKECTSVREEAGAPGDADKWRQRRNNSFDQNRQLEEVTKERDGLRRVAAALQRAVSQLVAYCASAEDELNHTVLAQLLGRLASDESFESDSRPSSPNLTDLNASAVSRAKHVHFAPDLASILASLDEGGVPGFLQQQRDLSADIKRELEHSLRRLRHEAHDLLQLSSRLAQTKGRQESKMLESSEVRITELVEDFESKKRTCDNCEIHKKNMEEAMLECLQREGLLRADLDAAVLRISRLLAGAERAPSDLIAEGYGLGVPGPGAACRSLDDAASPRAHSHRLAQDLDALQRERDDLHQQVSGLGVPGPGAACRSLDDAASPRAHSHRLAQDLDALQRERDDLHQQLEAANRQLRSTRQFVEEQAAEREAERDEFARREGELREEAARLAARLQTNARILAEVEQLEAQTRDMNQIINDLEERKATAADELKASEEKVALLRDIITGLETQLEQKATRETEVLQQLECMRQTIEERDGKMRALLGELEALRSERAERSELACARCGEEDERAGGMRETVKEQARWLEERIHRRTRTLERVHEVCSAPCSEPSEDVSIRDLRNPALESGSPEGVSARGERLLELAGVWEALDAHARAEDAALRRIADLDMQRAQLKDVAQEVRAERDVLQARMSEQALRISSLSARLQQQRNDAAALAHSAHSALTVQLHDTHAEVQRLKEELESKDKQLARLRQTLDEREKAGEVQQAVYGNSCNPKDKVIILERELSTAQTKIAQLEERARALQGEKEKLEERAREQQQALAFREGQLDDLMALKLEEDPDEDIQERPIVEGKTSARTLSDIVSISEFDEQDLQMRRAELKHNLSLIPDKDATPFEKTLPPDVHRPNMSSLNMEYTDHFDVTNYTPRADSLPAHLTSTQNKEVQYKRNVNETTVFGNPISAKQCTPVKIQDNCSIYPNRDVNDSKNVSVEPKKINFSLAPSDNKTQEEQYTSFKELGISLDLRQINFPDILTQLKHEIKKSRAELDTCKSELKNAEEQLCEFPALKREVEELKTLLENTMATMEKDKKFYEEQLQSFTSNKDILEQRLAELTQEASEKANDLHLLKEDILRRENMILELAKEKRNLTNKLTELEGRIVELHSRNAILEKFESENRQLREKMSELQKLEQMVSEKNQQIDSLNQHLDRFDDLQRCLNDKTEEVESLKEALEEKTTELFQIQDSVESQSRDIARINEENILLGASNKELKLKLSKLEKEQENASLRLQSSESELERMSSLNNELISKIEELKSLNDQLKDKQTEIEILNEDLSDYHKEIQGLREQLAMVSRSPSPGARADARAGGADDRRQLARIKKQIALLQHELDFNKKELNDKAFELAKAKLDATELRGALARAERAAGEGDAAGARAEALRRDAERLADEKRQLAERLQAVMARLREESDVGELKEKLREKAERCQQLEAELRDLRDQLEGARSPGRAGRPVSAEARALALRSPTAELERALRDQLDYSHSLDEDIMEQILSASSDDREDIPRLALNTSKSSSSIHSSSSERLQRLRADNDKLQLRVDNLEARLRDKDALITELNRIRDKLVQDWQTASLRYEAERDNSARLQLLLESQKDAADSLQKQDSSMIEMLKRRLESAMQSEQEAQERAQRLQRRLHQLERPADSARHEMEDSERLRGEAAALRSRLEAERARAGELRAAAERERAHAQRELAAARRQCAALRADLAELRRLKHEAGTELVRSKELARTQSAAIAELEGRLGAARQRPLDDTLTDISRQQTELTALAPASPESAARARAQRPEQARASPGLAEDKDHAIRYLHGRVVRLESCRKALVWQKRYLQRVLAGYARLERTLRLPADPPRKPTFKCVATVVKVVVRMAFLVRRQHGARALAAGCLLRPRDPAHADLACTPSPLAAGGAGGAGGAGAGAAGAWSARAPAGLARRLLKHDLRLDLPASPVSGGDYIRRSPYSTNSPNDEPFILSTPRGDKAAAYLSRLQAVSRCLGQALEPARDVP